MNTSIQIRKQKTHKAVNKKLYNLRERADQILERQRLENLQPDIIVVFDRQRPISAPKQKEQPKKVQKSEAERQNELKKINSAITVYQNRIDAILPKEEQDELKKRKEYLKALRKHREVSKNEELKRVKEIIKDEEKSLETARNGFLQVLPETLKTKVAKLQKKLSELFEKREDFKKAKEVPETRGKKQEIHFAEFELSITMSGAWKDNEEFVKTFQELQTKFLKNDINRLFKGFELELNVVHLDQFSIHSHAMFKLPEGKTFDQLLRTIHRDGREAYKILNRAWHKSVERELKVKFGIQIEEMQSGKRYKSLKTFKKENPVPNHQKAEKINSSEDMSDISPHIRDLYKRAKANHELVNSLFKKEKTSEASERSDTSDSREQTESQSNRRNRR